MTTPNTPQDEKCEELAPCPKPTVVCLCGSTRFKDAFDEANYQETMKGKIVLSVGFFMHASGNKHGDGIGCTPEQKIALDLLHKRKIDLADEVLVLNVGGYIGMSTRSEMEYAMQHGKPIRLLEPSPSPVVGKVELKQGERDAASPAETRESLDPGCPPWPLTKMREFQIDFDDGEGFMLAGGLPVGKLPYGMGCLDAFQAYLAEMKDGDELTITVRRRDMTQAEIDAIPEQ